jgi:hypothetical protein
MTYEQAVTLAGQTASGAVRPTQQQKVEAAWARMLTPERYAARVARNTR